MKNGRLSELKLGLAAGNRFTVTLAELPSNPREIKAVKRERGIVRVSLGKSSRSSYFGRNVWQQLWPGDVIKGTGEHAPIYTAEELVR